MKFFQKLGKSLMLPVCVLPICGILMGIGYMLCPASMQGGEISGAVHVIGYLLTKAGSAVIDNMSILFVVGVAIGMSDDGHGAAALAGIASWLVITTLLSTGVMSVVYGGLKEDSATYLAFAKIQNPTIGMIAGLIGALCYNRFKATKLPDFLAFFSGRRSVAIVTVLVSLIVAGILALIWPACYGGMLKFGSWIASLGGVGSGIYAFLNRLLIPTGMHHALNNVFWFDTIGLGDLSNFWAGKTSEEVGWSLGMYMSGFFPCMIGGIPGAAAAIYRNAKNKKKALGVLFSTAFCSFLCGLTEPFEFSFMFMCFPLYVVYCVLYGIFSVAAYYLGFRAGFSFSAGVIDLVFSSSLPAAQKTWLIIPLSIAAFIVFYLVFAFVIRKFDLSIIPGDREEGPENGDAVPVPGGATAEEKDLIKARGILKAVGGKDNVTGSDCCATRLRLDLKDSSRVDRDLAIRYGAIDVICPSKTSCQVIIGLTVQQVLEAFRTAMTEPEETAAAETSAETTAAAGTAEAGTSEDVAGKGRELPAGPAVAHGQILRIRLYPEGEASSETSGKETARPAAQAEAAGKPAADAPAIPIRKAEDGTLSFAWVVRDPVGIHARPAGQIAQIVKDSGAEVTLEAGGKSASGKSPVQMMGLGVKGGTEITVKISGDPEKAEATAAQLSAFLQESL